MADARVLISCVGDLIGRCPAGSLLPLLRRTQQGLSVWIIDASQLVNTKVPLLYPHSSPQIYAHRSS